MSQYLLSVYYVEGQEEPSGEDIERMYAQVDALNQKMQDSGAWVFAGGLHTPDTATVVRVENSQIITTDGPFAETKEQLLGFILIEASDLNYAIEAVAKFPMASNGSIEVRPVLDLEPLRTRRVD